MGYYHCTCCDNFFETPFRINPECCPNCKNNHYMKEIQREQYFDWLDIKKYTLMYNEIQEEKKHEAFYKQACMIWDNWDCKHRRI